MRTNNSSLHTKRQKGYRLFCALFLCLALSSCAAKFAYGFLDWYMEWKINSYVTLKGEQKKQTKRAIDSFHKWHQETQLTLYAKYLRSLQARLNSGPISAKAVHAETDKVQVLFDQSLEKLLPDAVTILSTLSDKQVRQLLKTFVKKRDKYTKKFIDADPKKRHKKRTKELRKEMKHWIGSLTKEQKQWINQWSRDLIPYNDLFLVQQTLWEQELEVHLAKRDDTEKLSIGVRQLMLYRTDHWDKALQEVTDKNQALTYTLFAKILNNLTEKQRKKLNKRINTYTKDLDALIKEAA